MTAPNSVIVIQPVEEVFSTNLWYDKVTEELKRSLPSGITAIVLPWGTYWSSLNPPSECSDSCRNGCLDEYPEEYEWLLHWGYQCGWQDAMKVMRIPSEDDR
jgi:hypothetical protein